MAGYSLTDALPSTEVVSRLERMTTEEGGEPLMRFAEFLVPYVTAYNEVTRLAFGSAVRMALVDLDRGVCALTQGEVPPHLKGKRGLLEPHVNQLEYLVFGE